MSSHLVAIDKVAGGVLALAGAVTLAFSGVVAFSKAPEKASTCEEQVKKGQACTVKQLDAVKAVAIADTTLAPGVATLCGGLLLMMGGVAGRNRKF